MRWCGVIFLCVLILTACGGDTAPTVGTSTVFSDACAKANDGKRVAVDGYLRFPDSFTDSQSVVLRLYEMSDFTNAPIGVQIPFGSQANQVEKVANNFTDDDLQVHLQNGQTAKFGTKVRVSGKVYFPLVAQEFACSLENPLVELAA